MTSLDNLAMWRCHRSTQSTVSDLHNLQCCLAYVNNKANSQIQAMTSLKGLNSDLEKKLNESGETGEALEAKRDIQVKPLRKIC